MRLRSGDSPHLSVHTYSIYQEKVHIRRVDDIPDSLCEGWAVAFLEAFTIWSNMTSLSSECFSLQRSQIFIFLWKRPCNTLFLHIQMYESFCWHVKHHAHSLLCTLLQRISHCIHTRLTHQPCTREPADCKKAHPYTKSSSGYSSDKFKVTVLM